METSDFYSAENFKLKSQLEEKQKEIMVAITQNRRLVEDFEQLTSKNDAIIQEITQLNSQKEELRQQLEVRGISGLQRKFKIKKINHKNLIIIITNK